MRGLGSKGWLAAPVVPASERRLEIAVSERASMNSFTMKSRLEKSSRVKLGPWGNTVRAEFVVMDALSIMIDSGQT